MRSLEDFNKEIMRGNNTEWAIIGGGENATIPWSDRPMRNGIACPECESELMDSNPSVTLTSHPPQKNTKCSVCEYTGYRLA